MEGVDAGGGGSAGVAWVIVVAARTGRLWLWFAAGPVIAVVCGVLLVARVPLDVRWTASW